MGLESKKSCKSHNKGGEQKNINPMTMHVYFSAARSRYKAFLRKKDNGEVVLRVDNSPEAIERAKNSFRAEQKLFLKRFGRTKYPKENNSCK